ncbi:hypothetical protein CCACVL1_03215 [Corchorus capsularis]|uniref:Uncharacterized protein n=1 Tax=Corchorus capsularis TaxID=210143 RepID=A0A1R3K1K3_COCAP|nr:hypothetical protein CCACVL1_03215 [Corchorus capsularis]
MKQVKGIDLPGPGKGNSKVDHPIDMAASSASSFLIIYLLACQRRPIKTKQLFIYGEPSLSGSFFPVLFQLPLAHSKLGILGKLNLLKLYDTASFSLPT